jgi:hypothetical protein
VRELPFDLPSDEIIEQVTEECVRLFSPNLAFIVHYTTVDPFCCCSYNSGISEGCTGGSDWGCYTAPPSCMVPAPP